MNNLQIMLHSQNFTISLDEEDDFNIFLSVSLHEDFKQSNITRLQMLNAYVEKVYELYLQELEVSKIIDRFEAQDISLPFTDSDIKTVIT